MNSDQTGDAAHVLFELKREKLFEAWAEGYWPADRKRLLAELMRYSWRWSVHKS